MEYAELIEEANRESDPIVRLAYATAFLISQYSSTVNRTRKPFNPILGETYELKTEKWRFVSEQVSHHPPISACYADNENYEMWMNSNLKTGFYGKSLEFKPLGSCNLKLKKHNDHFVL